MEKPPEYTFKQNFDLVLSMRQLYNLFDVLKFFKREKVFISYLDRLKKYFNQNSAL